MDTVPRRPHVALQLRLPPELHARLGALAEADHRSLTAEIVRVMGEWADQREREREAPPDPPKRGPNERRGTFTSGRSPRT